MIQESPNQELVEDFKKMQKAFATQSFEASKAIIEAFQKKYPDRTESYSLLALGYLRQEDYTKAIEIVDQSVKINKEQSEAYHILGKIHIQRDNNFF